MRYAVCVGSSAERDLRHLPQDVLKRVDAKLSSLAREPRPRGSRKLHGREGAGWRVRVGEYRIMYTVNDDLGLVSVYGVRPRGSAYR